MSVLRSSFRRYFMAIAREERLLQSLTAALEAAGIRYAVIG